MKINRVILWLYFTSIRGYVLEIDYRAIQCLKCCTKLEEFQQIWKSESVEDALAFFIIFSSKVKKKPNKNLTRKGKTNQI